MLQAKATGRGRSRREDFGELVELPVEEEISLLRREASRLPTREEVEQAVAALPERTAIDYGGKCAAFSLSLKRQLPSHFEVYLCGSASEDRIHTYLLIRTREGFLYVDPSIKQYVPDHPVTFVGSKEQLMRLIFDPKTVLNTERCGKDRAAFFRKAYGDAALDYLTDQTFCVE